MALTQRRHHHAALRNESEGIRSARAVLDHATRNAMPTPYLPDTRPTSDNSAAKQANHRKAPVPLRLIRNPGQKGIACGFGTCSLNPECTARCRYREADEALRGHYSDRHTQRQEEPHVSATHDIRDEVDPVLRRRVILGILAVYFVVAVAAYFSLN